MLSASLVFGTVTDPSGAVFPGAQITLINENTGQTKTVESGATGDYVAPLLPVGVYLATVQLEGFRTTERPGLSLSAVQNVPGKRPGSRMFTADPDGGNLHLVEPYGKTSHFIWRDSKNLLLWAWHPSHEWAY